jgi:hypothetical protein
MAERLTACRGCSRHVKASDATCPFCGAPMAGVEPALSVPFRRMAAAAAVASAAALVGCTSSTPALEAQDGSASDDSGPSTAVFYGSGEPYDGSVSTGVFYGGSEPRDAGRKADAGADGSLDAAPDATEDGSLDGATDAETDGATDAKVPQDAGENG